MRGGDATTAAREHFEAAGAPLPGRLQTSNTRAALRALALTARATGEGRMIRQQRLVQLPERRIALLL